MPLVYKCDSCGETTEKQVVLCPECVHINAINAAILLATQYMNQNKVPLNSYISMASFIDWLQKKERKE